ncbi:MAG: hypothetical protein E6H87_09860 [Chloroflexi bacterium]|nr:MAG: hypothetical protein E6H87_09860 [Chloroflexota bacterium]
MRELYQVVEVGPAWYQENIPCQEACPVKTNCRGYLNLAAAGEFEKGWELALDDTCGRAVRAATRAKLGDELASLLGNDIEADLAGHRASREGV